MGDQADHERRRLERAPISRSSSLTEPIQRRRRNVIVGNGDIVGSSYEGNGDDAYGGVVSAVTELGDMDTAEANRLVEAATRHASTLKSRLLGLRLEIREHERSFTRIANRAPTAEELSSDGWLCAAQAEADGVESALRRAQYRLQVAQRRAREAEPEARAAREHEKRRVQEGSDWRLMGELMAAAEGGLASDGTLMPLEVGAPRPLLDPTRTRVLMAGGGKTNQKLIELVRGWNSSRGGDVGGGDVGGGDVGGGDVGGGDLELMGKVQAVVTERTEMTERSERKERIERTDESVGMIRAGGHLNERSNLAVATSAIQSTPCRRAADPDPNAAVATPAAPSTSALVAADDAEARRRQLLSADHLLTSGGSTSELLELVKGMQSEMARMQRSQAEMSVENARLRRAEENARLRQASRAHGNGATYGDEAQGSDEDEDSAGAVLARFESAKARVLEVLEAGSTPTAEMYASRNGAMCLLDDAQLRAEYEWHLRRYVDERETAANVRGMCEMALIKLGELVDKPKHARRRMSLAEFQAPRAHHAARANSQAVAEGEAAERERQAAMHRAAYDSVAPVWRAVASLELKEVQRASELVRALHRRLNTRAELGIVTMEPEQVRKLPPASFQAMGTGGLRDTEVRAVIHALGAAKASGVPAQRFVQMLAEKAATLPDFVAANAAEAEAVGNEIPEPMIRDAERDEALKRFLPEDGAPPTPSPLPPPKMCEAPTRQAIGRPIGGAQPRRSVSIAHAAAPADTHQALMAQLQSNPRERLRRTPSKSAALLNRYRQ